MRLLTISPVRLTVSPSLTRRSEPKSTTPTWPASKFMHIPLTPDANLLQLSVLRCGRRENFDLLDELLSLDVGHAVDTGDTITNPLSAICSSSLTPFVYCASLNIAISCVVGIVDIPDGQDTAGLGEASLLLDTADSLLEDRGDLSWGGLGLSVGAGLDSVEGSWGNSSGLQSRTSVSRVPRENPDHKLEELQNSSQPSSCIAHPSQLRFGSMPRCIKIVSSCIGPRCGW